MLRTRYRIHCDVPCCGIRTLTFEEPTRIIMAVYHTGWRLWHPAGKPTLHTCPGCTAAGRVPPGVDPAELCDPPFSVRYTEPGHPPGE